jgi:TrmH family RNA methyltransferase
MKNEAVRRSAAAPGTPRNVGGVLTSRENRWLKEFRVALRGGVPTTTGAVGVEGVRLVEEALSSGCRIEAVLFSDSGERYREKLAPLMRTADVGFPVLQTTDRLFEGIADTEHPQGVAALVVPKAAEIADVLATPEGVCAPLAVVLAGVQDPGNVGTIVRTAAAFGATGVVTAATGQSGTASPFAPKALRASAGATLHLPVVTGMALGILLTQLKLNGVRTVASCAHEEGVGLLAPWEVQWCEPVALLVGNEGAGLPEDVVHAADGRIHIPMATLPSYGQALRGSGPAKVESLSAGAAAAVVLYEAYRQRRSVVNNR